MQGQHAAASVAASASLTRYVVRSISRAIAYYECWCILDNQLHFWMSRNPRLLALDTLPQVRRLLCSINSALKRALHTGSVSCAIRSRVVTATSSMVVVWRTTPGLPVYHTGECRIDPSEPCPYAFSHPEIALGVVSLSVT